MSVEIYKAALEQARKRIAELQERKTEIEKEIADIDVRMYHLGRVISALSVLLGEESGLPNDIPSPAFPHHPYRLARGRKGRGRRLWP